MNTVLCLAADTIYYDKNKWFSKTAEEVIKALQAAGM